MKNDPPNRKILGPFNRVEGDLEVTIETENNVIRKAWVNSPLFRGYEQILQGKNPKDALVYTPRICGICSVAQSVAAAQAIASAQGITPEINGSLATNLILATENLADHLTHFYLFFMPDFARDCYQNKPWHEKISQRFKAQTGTAVKDVLPARAAFLHITGILAGKWPHSLAIQPGGTTRAIETQEKIRLSTIIHTFRYFLEQTLFGTTLEEISTMSDEKDIEQYLSRHPQADFARFLQVADDLELITLGRSTDQFLSYGAYQHLDTPLFIAGTWQQQMHELNQNKIREDSTHSWFDSQQEPQHPYHGNTIPGSHEEDGYSWCKAPRLDHRVMEVGAIARQMVDGHPLINNLVSNNGANVRSRVIARLLEIARIVPAMEQWAKDIQPKAPFCHETPMPSDGQGAGLIEAARGSLGHWLRIKNGRILNYQIIAPTTWNFSPRDHLDQPGALEQALQGTLIHNDQKTDVLIQHIIRSFDPCMVCTVH